MAWGFGEGLAAVFLGVLKCSAMIFIQVMGDLSTLAGDGGAGEVAGGPGRLEVEPAGDAVDVEDFAREVEAGLGLAFHRLQIEVLEGDSTAGDELVLVGALAGDLEGSGGEFGDEGVELGLGEVGPGLALANAGGLAKSRPQASGDAFDEGALLNLSDAVLAAFVCEDSSDFLGLEVAGPVQGEREAVVARCQFPRGPSRELENGRSAEAPVSDQDGPSGHLPGGLGCAIRH